MAKEDFKMKNKDIRHRANSYDSKDEIIRLAILGPSKVGKSSLIKRYLYEKFDDRYSTTIEDLHKERHQVNGLEYEVDILDTCGTKEFPNLRNMAIRNSHGFILVYSLDDRRSFERMLDIFEDIKLIKEDFESIPIVFVGNKSDIEKTRKTSLDARKGYTDMVIGREVMHVESSAKDDINVSFIFDIMMRNIIMNRGQPKKKERRSSLSSLPFFKKAKSHEKLPGPHKQRKNSFSFS